MKNLRRLKIVALIPAGLSATILLLFAIGETASGDWSGVGHLFFAVPIGLLMWLGWRRPLWGGILLILVGLLAVYLLFNLLRGPGWSAPFLIMVAPPLLSGLLLLVAARLENRAS